MASKKLNAPQLITDARMVYVVWIPADPDAAKALVPKKLKPQKNAPVFINQYVVDDEKQTSSAGFPKGFGAYSLTYLGVDLAGLEAQPGIPGRWWTHYFNSSANMRAYARERGVPAEGGRTTLEIAGARLVATTYVREQPLIRTTATVDPTIGGLANGQLLYVTKVGSRFMSGRYPFVNHLAREFRIESVEFLNRRHPVYALRPKEPIEITFSFYSPRISFCYPGGVEALK